MGADRPTFSIQLLAAPAKKGSTTYQDRIELARQWHGTIKVLIAQADRADQDAASTSTSVTREENDLASQIARLADLCREGLMTEAEFTAAKSKLLAAD
jgi:hypothetical protein